MPPTGPRSSSFSFSSSLSDTSYGHIPLRSRSSQISFCPIATALSAIGHSTFSPAHPSSPHIPFVPPSFTECISCSSRSVSHQLPCHRTYCRTSATGALKPSVAYSHPSDFSPGFCTLFRVPQRSILMGKGFTPYHHIIEFSNQTSFLYRPYVNTKTFDNNA